MALALVIGVAGGVVANAVGLPLAWMLGPLFACGAAALAGVELRFPPLARELGQVVIGLAIGLRLTPPVLAATAGLLPAMVVATLYVMAITTAAAFVMRPLGRVDPKTAFFATAAAGVVEMAIVARARGGDADAVSVVQALRVSVVVTLVPLLVFAFGADGGLEDAAGMAPLNIATLTLLLALGVGAALVLRRFRWFPNPWVFGPMLVGMAASGTLPTAMPWPLLVAAQVALGVALGCRFDRALLTRLPRVTVAGVAVALMLIAAAGAAATVLSAATGLSYATSFLALAPAGVTEMVLTAKIMHLDTVSVTAFHVMRIVVINATILVNYALFDRLSRWTGGA